MSSGKVESKGDTMLTKVLILVAALGAPIVGEPAQQTAPSASAAASTEQAKPAEPKKVCVTEAQLGSHFKKRNVAASATLPKCPR